MNKLFLSIKLNTIAILAAIFNFIEFLKLAILRIFSSTEKFLTSFGVIIWLFFSISCFWSSKDIGFGIYALILLGIFIGAFIYIFSLVSPIIIAILEIIFNVLNFLPAINFLNRKLAEKFNEYMKFSTEDSGKEKIELLPTYLIYWVAKVIKNKFSVIRVLVYPVSVIFFGWCAYSYVFIQYAAPSPDDRTFIPSIILVMILTMAGVAFMKSVFDTIKSSIEDTDFGFLDILFWYFSNEDFSSSQQEEQKHSSNTTTESDSNPYYNFFGTASTYEELKRMYHEKITEYHPDNAKTSDIEYSTKESAKIIEAFKYYKKYKFNK